MIQDYEKEFDELRPVVEEPIITNHCVCNYVLVDGYPTCERCGIVQIDKPSFVLSYHPRAYNTRRNIPYNRKTFWNQLLNLITGRKQLMDVVKWYDIVHDIKTSKNNFSTIHELKLIMKAR